MDVVDGVVLAALLAVACCWLASVARLGRAHGDPSSRPWPDVGRGAVAVVEQNAPAHASHRRLSSGSECAPPTPIDT